MAVPPTGAPPAGPGGRTGNILEEFLISLGYREDEPSRRRFDDNLLRMTNRVMGLGAAVTAMAAGAAIGVARVSSSFDNMYWLSQRVQSSVATIKGFQHAFTQLGGSAEQAAGIIDRFASFTRTTGGRTWIQSHFGIDATSMDRFEALAQVAERLKAIAGPNQEHFWQALMLSEEMGIDEQSLIVLLRDTAKFRGEWADMYRQSGVNADDAHKKGMEFQRMLNVLGAQFDILKMKLFDRLFDRFGPMMERLVRYLEKDGDKIVKQLEELVEGFIKLVDAIDSTATAFGGWKDVGLAILAFFGITWLAGMLAVIASVSAALAPLLVTAGVIYGAYKLYQAASDPVQSDIQSAATFVAGPGKLPAGEVLDRQEEALRYFTAQGWSYPQAAGIAAQIMNESAYNNRAVGDRGKAYGILQWHPDRQAAFAEWSRAHGGSGNIRGSSYAEQLAFIQYELTQGAEQNAGNLLRGTRTGAQAGAVLSRHYVRPRDREGEAAERGTYAAQLVAQLGAGGRPGSNVTLNHKTDIHVSSTDPREASELTLAGQRNVYNDQVRNFQGHMK